MSKYSIISEKRRIQLINLIKNNGKTIVSAAKKLKIKISTAKSILSSFEKNGKVLKKKKYQKIDKQRNEKSSNHEVSPQCNPVQKEQAKKKQEIDCFPEKLNTQICLKPVLMLSPVLMSYNWSYMPFNCQFQSFKNGYTFQ